MKQTALLLLLAECCLVLLPTPATADVVTDWNEAALTAIRRGRTPPPIASRGLAILHVSIFDAVNGITRNADGYLPAGSGPQPPASAAPEAAASAAAHKALVALFPEHAADFDTLHAAILVTMRHGRQITAGTAWGEQVAGRILAARAGDGWDSAAAAPGGSGPGIWVPTPPDLAAYQLPQWGFLLPFTMTSGSQFRPPGPPALDSPRWAADFNEVKSLGAAVGSARTLEQAQIALFWADGAGTETPPGHWNSIARATAAARGNSLEENARLFALLNLAMADAAICAWDAKYHFNFWRPVTAIRRADTDGNPATEPDAGWSSFIVTPPFPDYVSGHSTFSGAAATVLALFYGTDQVAFTTGSDFLPGVTRSFDSFSAAAEEAALSRVYGGIHFRSASDDGLAGGAGVGQWTFTQFLRPKPTRSRAAGQPVALSGPTK